MCVLCVPCVCLVCVCLVCAVCVPCVCLVCALCGERWCGLHVGEGARGAWRAAMMPSQTSVMAVLAQILTDDAGKDSSAYYLEVEVLGVRGRGSLVMPFA